jgi:hypothetical protein
LPRGPSVPARTNRDCRVLEGPLSRNREIREQLARLLAASGDGKVGQATGPAKPPAASRESTAPQGEVDVVVTFNEVNARHGTGVLLQRIFGEVPDIVSLRGWNTHGGDHAFGSASRCLPRTGLSRREIFGIVLRWLGPAVPRRVLCIPYKPDDVLIALAVKEVFDVPLATWIMDDQNVAGTDIPDSLMEELLTKSNLRLAIAPEMRAVYQDKYRLKFWMFPPVVSGDLVRSAPPDPLPTDRDTGILVGNVWGQGWLDLLRRAVRDSGITIDWYCNSGVAPRWLRFDRDGLARDGIVIHDSLPEPAMAEVLRQHTFTVVPSGTLNDFDDRRDLSWFSLPTRIPFIVAATNTPIVVLGSPQTAAARFVTRFGVGVVAEYHPVRFREAVSQITSPGQQEVMRQNACAIASTFRADGAAEWIWSALRTGEPADLRFERLFPGEPLARAEHVP